MRSAMPWAFQTNVKKAGPAGMLLGGPRQRFIALTQGLPPPITPGFPRVNHMRIHCIATSFFLLAVTVCRLGLAVDYLTDVKPILTHKCYACHGGLKQQAGLRLDTASAIREGGDSGQALEAGDPQSSLIIDAVTGDAGYRMPPENQGVALTAAEIDTLRKWIAEGAIGPENEQPQEDTRQWWSYRQVVRQSAPNIRDPAWANNAIDNFVAATRDKKGLAHAGDASPQLWLRRVHLDLIGIPPTRQQLHSFLADERPNARAAVVDSLLASPLYGQRWGRHWMDVWRYSDWYGSRGGNEIRYSQRHIWRWRDWIVNSLNNDDGYDQMVVQMLAGDELAGNDPDVLPATGYLGRNWYKFDRNVWMFETVERTGEAFLGVTMRCCRCHDHKFDPISQEEYYRFRAFFEPHDVRTDPVSALTSTQKDAKLGQVLNDGIARVYDKDLKAVTYRFERGDGRYPDKSKPLAPSTPVSLGGETVDVQPVSLPADSWYPALREGYGETLVSQARKAVSLAEKKHSDGSATIAKLQAALAERKKLAAESPAEASEVLVESFDKPSPDRWRTLNGEWTYADGKLTQSMVTSFATMVSKQDHPTDFSLQLKYLALAPGSYRSVGFSFDFQDKGNSQDVYTSTGDARQSVQAFHRLGGKQVYPQAGIIKTELAVGKLVTLDVTVQGSKLTIDVDGERKLDYKMPTARRTGKLALWVHSGAAEFHELRISKLSESIESLEQKLADAKAANALASKSTELARAELISIEARLASELATHLGVNAEQTNELLAKARTAESACNVLRAEIELAAIEKQSVSDDQKKILKAAESKLAKANEAAKAPSGTITPLGEQFPKTSSGRRLALANWIVDAKNPRTSRVAANHIWGRHFGRPMVDTTENFGLNGRTPSHPQLLDWLASELVENGWRMKPIHRQIVLSRTYAMSSSSNGDTESLAADPENVFLWRMNSRRMEAEVVRDSTLRLAGQLDLAFGGPEFKETLGESVLRRSLYFRNTPNEKMELLEVFDVADPNSCYRRKESVVPNQSLALMNSGLAVDCARRLAKQLPADRGAFVEAAFETVLGRSPSQRETERCDEFLLEHKNVLGQKSTERFGAGGTAKLPASTDLQLRARENLVHVLILHNDFVTVR